MRAIVKIEGLAELDAALHELPKQIARNAAKRVLKKAGEPIAEAARRYAPRDTGRLADNIVVSAKVQNNVGKAEFAEAMQAGLGRDAAVSAMRDARRAAKGKGDFAVMYVGPRKPRSKREGIKQIVQEFGSKDQPGHAYMRPAWDGNKDAALNIIKTELGPEIQRTAERLAKRKAK